MADDVATIIHEYKVTNGVVPCAQTGAGHYPLMIGGGPLTCPRCFVSLLVEKAKKAEDTAYRLSVAINDLRAIVTCITEATEADSVVSRLDWAEALEKLRGQRCSHE